MKKLLLTLSLITLTLEAFGSVETPYDRDRIKNFIEHTGTTHEPLIQIQALAGAMASYNALLTLDRLIESNNYIVKQNEEILKLLKKGK